jgi:hypothetical protein
MEDNLSAMYGTYVGQSVKTYRGQRQNPMDAQKYAGYQKYAMGC